MHRHTAAVLVGLILLGAAPAVADDVTDQINEALQAYEAKDLATAAAAPTSRASTARAATV